MALVTKERERDFEKRHILRQKDRYLATDVIQRVELDRAYREKISLLEAFLGGHAGGAILDLGSNTSGEAEVLAHRGHPIVATDINEIALALSRQRAEEFGRMGPDYFAADAHRLPFAPESFGSVIAFEVLHHFEQLEAVLGELFRVLRPGGRLFAYEPFALNPYRRLAELRFLALGSIERSFTISGLRRRVETAGLQVESIARHVLPASDWKKQYVTRFRAFLKDLYYETSRRLLPIFGNIVIVAQKPGSPTSTPRHPIASHLECPITGATLSRDGDFFVSRGKGEGYRYPIVDGIPVLIPEDAEPMPTSRL